MNGNTAFLNHQLIFPRVQLAKQQTDRNLSHLHQKNGVNYPPKSIYLRAFKQEQLLEIWATDAVQFKFIKSYTFTAFSGKIGPKLREGDLQIPEGFILLMHSIRIQNFIYLLELIILILWILFEIKMNKIRVATSIFMAVIRLLVAYRSAMKILLNYTGFALNLTH